MGIQQEKGGFALSCAIGTLKQSVASFWKPLLVAAPLIGTALFFASGTQAQTSGSASPSTTTSTSGPVAPIETAAAARRKGPKIKEKTATDTSRVASPSPTEPTISTPVAPIDAPEAARRKGPKEKVKEISTRVESPAPATEPVAQPEAARAGRPKIKEGHQTPLRVGDPATQTPAPTEKRREGPKGDEGSGRTAPTPAPDTQPTGRRKGPKGDGSHGRTATTPLIIGALSAAAILALVVSGGNDRPASP